MSAQFAFTFSPQIFKSLIFMILCLCFLFCLRAGTASSWPLAILSCVRSRASTCLTTACTLQILQGKLCPQWQQTQFFFWPLMQDAVIVIPRREVAGKYLIWCNQLSRKGSNVTLLHPRERIDRIDRDCNTSWLVPTPPDRLTVRADSLYSQQGEGG